VQTQHDLPIRRTFVEVVDAQHPALAVRDLGVVRSERIIGKAFELGIGGSNDLHGTTSWFQAPADSGDVNRLSKMI
jgi:uncharacterized protein YfaQ (DUF2300 family)